MNSSAIGLANAAGLRGLGPYERGPRRARSIASGAVITVAGPAYVGYQGAAYPFKTMTQLANDGYGGTAAVPTPHAGGLPVILGHPFLSARG